MIREICRDEAFLSQKAQPATLDDLSTAQDLLDTLAAHKSGCVGMAANMIGVNKHIIAFDNEGTYMVSLSGTRKAKRFQAIKVRWQNEKFQTRLKTFTGWTAEIIQHELDHCQGILI